jgi:hypothetical protein
LCICNCQLDLGGLEIVFFSHGFSQLWPILQ